MSAELEESDPELEPLELELATPELAWAPQETLEVGIWTDLQFVCEHVSVVEHSFGTFRIVDNI